jgi:hypothetical protein
VRLVFDRKTLYCRESDLVAAARATAAGLWAVRGDF